MQQSKVHTRSFYSSSKAVTLLYNFVSAISYLQSHVCKHMQVLIRQDRISAPQQKKLLARQSWQPFIRVRKVAVLQIMADNWCPAVDASEQEQQSVKHVQRAVTSELEDLL